MAVTCLFPEPVRQSAQLTGLLLILMKGRSERCEAGADLASQLPEI
jgi:hypothetical protein